MEGLELVVVVGAILVVGGIMATWLRMPSSLVFLLLGAAVGFVPFLDAFGLPPELMLLLFLPALLYREAHNTSLREIRRNLRAILLMAIVLVFVTAAAVALIGHALGLSWPMALVLGAILAPTDATAVAAVAGRMPRRFLTTLRAESLINDGTALVLYAIFVSAAVSGTQISIGGVGVQFVASYGLGVVIGVAVAFAVMGLVRLITDRLVANTLSVLTPFLAYLPAEALGVSGVVAVVTCGLAMTQLALPLVAAGIRSQAVGFWRVSSFILNGALFVLIGFEFHRIVHDLGEQWLAIVGAGLAVALAVLGTRIVWISTVPYVIRAVDRRPSQRALRVGWRQRVPVAWGGFRGAVSLAAALALPTHAADGEPLAGRDLVIAITFVVILFTLLVQGLTMPAVVGWAKLPPDPTEVDEELLAEQTSLQAALDELPAAANRIGAPDNVAQHLRTFYEQRLAHIHRSDDPSASYRDGSDGDTKSRLEAELLPAQRASLIGLLRRGEIDDVILRRIQTRLDLDELRLSGNSADDE